jgi:hypothetical protein
MWKLPAQKASIQIGKCVLSTVDKGDFHELNDPLFAATIPAVDVHSYPPKEKVYSAPAKRGQTDG